MRKIIFLITVILFAACGKNDVSTVGDATGKNGSITRFAIKDNLMYAIDINYLRVFDISDGDNPVLVQSMEVAYGIETIFIYENYIYLGAVDGVYVIDINNPISPHQLQKIEHHITCDPVVVQNNYAYSTQRVTTTGCGNHWFQSALAVYDVSDINNSVLKKEITMGEPYGLAVEGSWLFVCDAVNGGILVFDITDPADPVEKSTANVIEPRDIILNYPYMLVATNTSFELYNYSDPLNIHFVSTFELY